MPEGPEIKREADSLQRVLLDERIEDIHFGLPRLSHHRTQWIDTVIQSVRPYSKAMTIENDLGQVIYSHNQLYGKWEVVKPTRTPRWTNRQKRIEIQTQKGRAILWSASDIRVFDKSELMAQPYIQKLGPDLLNEQLSPQKLLDHLMDPSFQKRSWAALFLDQGFLAGMGNYLRSEILFHAQMDPTLKPKDTKPTQIKQLAKSIVTIMDRAYRQKGVTVAPSQAKNIKGKGSYRKKRFYVFANKGKPCPRCKTKIDKVMLAGRRLYLCPKCQKA